MISSSLVFFQLSIHTYMYGVYIENVCNTANSSKLICLNSYIKNKNSCKFVCETIKVKVKVYIPQTKLYMVGKNCDQTVAINCYTADILL